MGLDLEYIEGQTPIDEEERVGLKIKTISTKGELDEFEQKNIEKAIEWTMRRKFTIDEILTEEFVLEIHRQMFRSIWIWAGKIRKTNKNIGVDKSLIATELKQLLDDCKYWIDHNTFPPDEIAIRFKHRLVKTHIFSNGNGRHSRLCADVLISNGFGLEHFSWGASNLAKKGENRKKYLDAIHQADDGIYEPLVRFARS
ncbi:MAG: mobile mystery protein B [Bacteroidales bacterium]|nr:mobile mystery protein B [Bacteroidales bacterium]